MVSTGGNGSSGTCSNPQAAVGQRTAEAIPRTRLARSPDAVSIPLDGRVFAARPASQELPHARMDRHEPVDLLAAVATEEANRDGAPSTVENPPHAARVLPATQHSNKIKAAFHLTCIP